MIRSGVWRSSTCHGFTLVEMLVVLAVLAVTLTLVAPGFTDLIRDNRMISSVNGLRAALHTARSEAIARRAPVRVCATSNGTACDGAADAWAEGYMAFVNAGGGGAPDEADADQAPLLWERGAVTGVIATHGAGAVVDFDATGAARGTAGTITFCDDRGDLRARALVLLPIGAVNSAQDTDDDGIVNDRNGNVSCD
ncbi:MAG: GspH/FimT family pseudopilin [Haliea sp.]|uniref:GspH/FimT family pseudopilin n=1 Tax=Haliea sp. TaxID=1932666 RepID=UPI0032EB8EAB